nr:transposase [Mesorhizobium sp.]
MAALLRALRNALDHLPRNHGDDCLQELRWLYDRRDLAEAKADLAAWLAKWSARYPRLTTRVHADLLLPAAPAPQAPPPTCLNGSTRKSDGATCVVRVFPNAENCLRLVRALAVETNETGWRPTVTSTWTTCASTRSSLCAKPHDQHHGRPLFAELDAHNPTTAPGSVTEIGH